MVQRFLLVLMLICSAPVLYAQFLQPPAFYLAHPGVSQSAKDFYNKGIDTGTNDNAYAVLDSVFTENNDTRPFYIFLAGRMLARSQGDLRSELAIVCKYITEMHPSYVISVLFPDGNKSSDVLKDLWAERMSVEIRISCTGDLLGCFKQSRTDALARCYTTDKMRLEILYNKVRKDLNLFQ